MRSLAALTVAAVASACASTGGRSAAPCVAVDGRLPVGAGAAAMTGTFSLTLVATSGRVAGQTASGTMALRPQDSALVRMDLPGQQPPGVPTVPVVGTAEIDLERVGATRMGDLASGDATAPGVAAYEQQQPNGGPTVVVRLGSASNARGLLVFDAGHTTLYVKRIDTQGFAGGWSSSTGTGFPVQESAGYFCAVRR